MSAQEAAELVKLFRRHGIDVCIDGGWGVDALLGKQTRRHEDLDIAIPHKDVELIRGLLEARGYRDVPRNDTRECNFVMGDAQGHLVDIHTYTFDAQGRIIFGVAYPLDALNGSGTIDGMAVKCITPEWMIKFHTGYAADENDCHDVHLLCKKYGLPLPEEYRNFGKREI